MDKKINLVISQNAYYSVHIFYTDGSSNLYYCDYYEDIDTLLHWSLFFSQKIVSNININRCSCHNNTK